MTTGPVRVETADHVVLEGELATPTDGASPIAAVVLCHPHPLHGGTMRSIVISALFSALPDARVTCLRFNFRGVEASGGVHDEGDDERLDAIAAIDTLAGQIPREIPLVLAGWSFGADVALSVQHPRVAAWLAIAGPLRSTHDLDALARDTRPKLLVLAQHDEIRAPADVETEVAGWLSTTVEIVPGASHFFIGTTDKLVVLARDFVSRVAAGSAG
jgi:uncharacterized protein